MQDVSVARSDIFLQHHNRIKYNLMGIPSGGLFVTRALLLLLGSTVFLFGGPADQYGLGEQDANTVVAEIDGTQITLAQFESKRPSVLFQARNGFFEAQKKAVEEYIDDLLLERQAQKENVTVAQLLERHVNGAIAKDPDDAVLRVYYEGVDTNEPFEAVRDKIVDHLRQRRLAKAKTAYIQALRSQSKITVDVAPPRIEVSLKDTPVRGPAGAPLMLVEYADYECPYCQQVQPTIDQLELAFKGKVAFAYKDLPLPMHPHAQKAAEASRCAGLQGKYWEYHDLLSKTKRLDVSQLKAGARQLGLETGAFDKCLDSGERAAAIKSSQDEAQKLGLQGTPSFFLNGRFFSGNLSYDQMRQMMEEELKRSSAQAQTARK
jgi:protein-disulfide isomerase